MVTAPVGLFRTNTSSTIDSAAGGEPGTVEPLECVTDAAVPVPPGPNPRSMARSFIPTARVPLAGAM